VEGQLAALEQANAERELDPGTKAERAKA